MKVTGIIAEYNPFHNGHAYQLRQLKKLHNPDYIVVAMSGDFLQRGTPALMNKYERAKMALSCGADMVFELPAYYSTASAELFAKGAIRLFHSTGLVDSFCFGAESQDLLRMQKLASLLAEEPDWYQKRLTSYLKDGLSYPAARAKALPEYDDLLSSPNNILALEYLKAASQAEPFLTPHLILREGSGYHDTSLDSIFPSASGIRHALFQHNPVDSESLRHALPSAGYDIFKNYTPYLKEDDFSLLLIHTLLKETADSLLEYEDVTDAMANRIIANRNKFVSWSDFCEILKSKEVTYTRISRILTHILLGIKKEDICLYQQNQYLPYLRVLGFKESAGPLLKQLKESAKAPIITNPASVPSIDCFTGADMLHTDIFASDLYRSVMTFKTKKTYPNEYQRKLLKLVME